MVTKVQSLENFWKNPSFQLMLGILLLIAGIALSDIPAMIASLSWPDVPGVITSRRFIGQKFREYDGDYYIRIDGYLKYHYAVDGISYSGFAVNALQEIACPQDKAKLYAVGDDVTITYNPRDPSQAVLEPGFVISAKAFGLTASLCCWIGLGFLALGLWRRLTGRRSFLRGWPDDRQSGRGIGIGSGRM